MTEVTLRPASSRDVAVIDGWLTQPEVQRWWGSLPAAQAAVIAALQTPAGLCSIVTVNGTPAGYIQAEEAQAGLISAPVEPGAYRLDAFIGEPRLRGQGVGRTALELASREVFETTLALSLVTVVSIRNEAAVRLFERAGFTWKRVLEDPLLGPCWLMVRPRR